MIISGGLNGPPYRAARLNSPSRARLSTILALMGCTMIELLALTVLASALVILPTAGVIWLIEYLDP